MADERAALMAVLRSGPAPEPGVPARRREPGRGRRSAVVAGLLVALVVVSVAALSIGSIAVPWSQVWGVLAHRAVGDLVSPFWTPTVDVVVADVRLPRVLLAGLVGGTLTVVGMAVQAVVRNPLAGPGVLGVSSGAATGAVLVLRFGVLAGAFALNIAAFLGALVTLVVVFVVARAHGTVTATRLLLSGMAISAVLSALTSLLVLTSPDPQLAAQVLFWTLGGFGEARWSLLSVPAVALLAGLVVLLAQARNLDLLLAGEESASVLGLDVHRFRQVIFVLAAALTGVAVAVSGVIGFVGLVLPHVVRLLVGAGHRLGLPVAVLLGAIFTIAADLVARTAMAPQELPVGIVTALVGGPFFVWLIRREAHREQAR